MSDASITCTHLGEMRPVRPNSAGCEECLRIGDTWVHLRMCMECGNVACCDDSKNKHATKHFAATTHPIIRSVQPGEHWKWCYVDRIAWE